MPKSDRTEVWGGPTTRRVDLGWLRICHGLHQLGADPICRIDDIAAGRRYVDMLKEAPMLPQLHRSSHTTVGCVTIAEAKYIHQLRKCRIIYAAYGTNFNFFLKDKI